MNNEQFPFQATSNEQNLTNFSAEQNTTMTDNNVERFEYPIASYAARGRMANEAAKMPSIIKKAKQLAVTAALALSITAALSACGGSSQENTVADYDPMAPIAETMPTAPTTSGKMFNGKGTITEADVTGLEGITEQKSGELANGVHYDYSHYADVKNKAGNPYSFDYDLSECYGDEKATADALTEVANRTPEVLASYAYQILFDSEKDELGIKDMTMAELDDYLSNAANEDGGVLQQRISDKLDSIFHDQENTAFKFYREYGHENSNYIYFYDVNNDGIMTPDEMHLAQSPRQRRGERQADLLRNNGQEFVKVADFNLPCGGQLNFTDKESPSGVPVMIVEMPEEVPEEKEEYQIPTDTSGGREPSKNENTGENIVIIHEPEAPTPDKNYTPEAPILDQKNISAEIKNTGAAEGIVKQESLNENVTPPTILSQDQANFAAIREAEAAKQREADAAAARQAEQAEAERQSAAQAAARREAERQQAEREAAAQREAERIAAEQAARRAAEQEAAEQAAREEIARQAAAQAARDAMQRQAADNAANNAYDEAEDNAEESAVSERSAAEEATTREEAQEQANEAAEAMAPKAEEVSTNDEQRDAEAWEFGAFDLGN